MFNNNFQVSQGPILTPLYIWKPVFGDNLLGISVWGCFEALKGLVVHVLQASFLVVQLLYVENTIMVAPGGAGGG